MSDFTNNRPAHVRMGEFEDEEKYDNETMADEERIARKRYQRNDSDPNVVMRDNPGTSPEAEEIH